MFLERNASALYFNIFKSLSHVQSIVEKKNTVPILSNILIEAVNNTLTLSATDMDISMLSPNRVFEYSRESDNDPFRF